MADYDVFVQVAETTVKTYRVRVTNSAKGMAEPVANAALRRALDELEAGVIWIEVQPDEK